MSNIIATRRYTPIEGRSIGVVVIKVNHKKAKGYIGLGEGLSEELDAKKIAQIGAKLEADVLTAMFPDVIYRGYDFIS